MAAIRMPGTLFSIWFVSPWPMNPAPTIPTRMGFPCSALAARARSTMIIWASHRHPPADLGLHLGERLPGRVLGGDLAHRERPGEPEPGVERGEPPLGGGGVELADLVARL